MKDFLKSLSKRLKCNTTAYENYHRVYVPEGQSPKSDPKEPLRVYVLFQHIQKMLSSETAVIAETEDSWFNCQKLKLPRGCRYEFQMQYGSIGWLVGVTLGHAQALPNKRVMIACIGNGSFYVTLLDISTMILYEQGRHIWKSMSTLAQIFLGKVCGELLYHWVAQLIDLKVKEQVIPQLGK